MLFVNSWAESGSFDDWTLQEKADESSLVKGVQAQLAPAQINRLHQARGRDDLALDRPYWHAAAAGQLQAISNSQEATIVEFRPLLARPYPSLRSSSG